VATGGGRSAALCEHAIDVQEHAPEIAIDLVVPIAQYFKPSRREMRISDSIFFLMFIKVMLPAVDLDDDASPQTYKIDDIAIPRRLSAEMKSARTPRAQMNPEFDLLTGHRLAELTRAFVSHRKSPHPVAIAARCRPPSPSGRGKLDYFPHHFTPAPARESRCAGGGRH
jgi:hypothetical protein